MFGRKGNDHNKGARSGKEASRWTIKGRKERAAANKATEKAAAKRTATVLLNILRWCVVAFLVIGALVYMPSVGSFVLILAAVLIAPISPIQNTLTRFFPKEWIAPVLAVVLFFVGISTADTGPHHTAYDPPSTSSSSTVTNFPQPSDRLLGEISSNEMSTPIATDPAVSQPVESEPAESETVESVMPTPSVVPSEEPTPATFPEDSTFEVHYIDVGQADATLVLCDGAAMLIDGGNAPDSNLIYAYLKKIMLPT